jgi:hypothetical protein
MKTYLDYMDDTDIINEPMALREIHAIRLLIQDETKDMTPKQCKERTQNAVLEAEKRIGTKFKRSGQSSQR